MQRRAQRQVVKARAALARQEQQEQRSTLYRLEYSVGGLCADDDGGDACAWCGGLLGRYDEGLCDGCARTSSALSSDTTRRRMIGRLHVRARRGQLDFDAYRAALDAHRGARG